MRLGDLCNEAERDVLALVCSMWWENQDDSARDDGDHGRDADIEAGYRLAEALQEPDTEVESLRVDLLDEAIWLITNDVDGEEVAETLEIDRATAVDAFVRVCVVARYVPQNWQDPPSAE